MKVVWTARAKQRLRELHDYIALDSPEIAAQIVRKLIVRSGELGVLPNIGRNVPEFESPDVREVYLRPYRIIYRVNRALERIEILTVRHYRQLMPGELAEL